jgi:cytochrome c oxidase cbb3-type subunit III
MTTQASAAEHIDDGSAEKSPVESETPETRDDDDDEDEQDADAARLMAHEYDGIREYDNPLPGWWRMIFVLSIGFAAAYGFYYHIARWGSFPAQSYVADLALYEGNRDVRAAAEAANISEASLATASRDSGTVARGSALFTQRCVSCHADKGQGLIGPNLTDLRQVHGTTRMDIYKVVANGVAGTAMLAWGEQLPQTDILALTVFVATLRGQNITGKEPQGAPVDRFLQ